MGSVHSATSPKLDEKTQAQVKKNTERIPKKLKDVKGKRSCMTGDKKNVNVTFAEGKYTHEGELIPERRKNHRPASSSNRSHRTSSTRTSAAEPQQQGSCHVM